MTSPFTKTLRFIGLSSAKRSILMLVAAWVISLTWLGFNYFWRFATVELLLAIPVISLIYSLLALVAYIYWGMREMIEQQEDSYAGIVVGAIVAVTLLYFNFNLLQFVMEAIK
jgi:hypothetical protein